MIGGWLGALALCIAGSEPDSAPSPSTPTAADSLAEATSQTAPARPRVLVLPLRADGVDSGLVATVDGTLATSLSQLDKHTVVTLADLDALLRGELLADLTGCDDVSCLSEIGGAAAADFILSGSVGRLGGDYVVSLSFVATGSLEAQHSSRGAHLAEDLGKAARRALLLLFERDAPPTTSTPAQRSRWRPSYVTFEAAGLVGFRGGAESYGVGPGATVRAAVGGRLSGGDLLYYGLIGAGVLHARGEKRGDLGTVRYERSSLSPFAEVRAALPLTEGSDFRLFAGLGAGATWESYRGTTVAGLRTRGASWHPEVRLEAGGWVRVSDALSLTLAYRSRFLFVGEGADPVSELISLGSSAPTVHTPEVELGVAWHAF